MIHKNDVLKIKILSLLCRKAVSIPITQETANVHVLLASVDGKLHGYPVEVTCSHQSPTDF